MFATDIGIAFVVLATVGLFGMLVAVLIWLLALIVRGVSRGRKAATPPTTPR